MKFPKADLARKTLSQNDAKLAKIIEEVGPIRIEIDPDETVFESLATSIVYQQLHGKAAAAILERLKNLYADCPFPLPQQIIDTPEETLRGTGLSRTKILSMKDLSEKTMEGALPSREKALLLSDEELQEALILVRGVGPWTAQMLMIFTLGRPDILPSGDYGVKRGYAAVYGKRKMPTAAQLETVAEKWRPFRSAASWYLWQALELERFKKVTHFPITDT